MLPRRDSFGLPTLRRRVAPGASLYIHSTRWARSMFDQEQVSFDVHSHNIVMRIQELVSFGGREGV